MGIQRSDGRRSFLVGALSFLLGVLLTLMLREAPPQPVVEAPVCPPPPACPSCGPPVAAQVGASRPRPPHPRAPRPPAPDPAVPLPGLEADEESSRERLRAWFQQQGPTLLGCLDKGEPRRRLLVEMKLEPDGAVADATLLGADELSEKTSGCVKSRVRALHAPKAEVRGRETLVVYVNL